MPVMIETVSEKSLTLVLSDEGGEVVVRWLGRSTARDPRVFVAPVLQKALELALQQRKALALDFRELEYFNSSTITPVVRLLQQVKAQGGRAVVRFRADLNWQRLSFSALHVLQGDGQQIVLDGGAA
jgi:hypothetical protein